MSLAPDLQDIFNSYEFSENERRHLIDYLKESKKQTARQNMSGDADWNKTISLHKELSEDSKDFINELNDYCTVWHYSDPDWVDVCTDLIKELKK